MSDLKERLRVGGWIGEETAYEAADRIEALEGALDRIRHARPSFEGGSIAECRRIAEKALATQAILQGGK